MDKKKKILFWFLAAFAVVGLFSTSVNAKSQAVLAPDPISDGCGIVIPPTQPPIIADVPQPSISSGAWRSGAHSGTKTQWKTFSTSKDGCIVKQTQVKYLPCNSGQCQRRVNNVYRTINICSTWEGLRTP